MKRKKGKRPDYEYKHDQAKRLFKKQGGICPVCNNMIKFYGSQRAHMVPAFDRHYIKWGMELVDHDDNMKLVCGNKCNDPVMLHHWEWDEHINKIKIRYGLE